MAKGSFKTSYADTDSLALALTKSQFGYETPEEKLRGLFDPLIAPHKRQSWEENWKKWFVTTNDVSDIRKPGKLKGNAMRLYIFSLYIFS